MQFFSPLFITLAILTCAGHTLAHPALSERQVSFHRKHQLAHRQERFSSLEHLTENQDENHSTNVLELNISEPIALPDHQPEIDGSSLTLINIPKGDDEQEIKLFRRKNNALNKIGGIAKALGKGGAQMAGNLIM